MAIVISVCNHKGGVGKTTTVINLAAALAGMGREVLVIDADGQANATMTLFDGDPFITVKTTIHLFIGKETNFSQLKHQSRVENVAVIPTNTRMLKTEREIQGTVRMIAAFKQAFDEQTRKEFDFILIDCPPHLDSFLTNALCISDYYIVPIGAEDGWALKGLKDLQDQVGDIKSGFNPNLKLLGLLITRYDQRNSASRAQRQVLESSLGRDVVLRTVINENTAIAKANASRKTIFQFDRDAQGAEDYSNLAKEVIDHVQSDGRSTKGNCRFAGVAEFKSN